MDDSLLTRYSRHIMLDDIGMEGQERLSAAKTLVIGAGGLGSAAAVYLAAAGVGELALCDDDIVELTNLQRQIIHTTHTVGMAKTASAAQHLNALNPHCSIREIPHRLTLDNAADIISESDIIIDGSDNYATRHLVNRTCVNLKNRWSLAPLSALMHKYRCLIRGKRIRPVTGVYLPKQIPRRIRAVPCWAY